MAEFATATETLFKYGIYFIAVIEAAAIVFLYKQVRAENAARLIDLNTYNQKILEIATKSIEADKDTQHAMALLAKSLERPNV